MFRLVIVFIILFVFVNLGRGAQLPTEPIVFLAVERQRSGAAGHATFSANYGDTDAQAS